MQRSAVYSTFAWFALASSPAQAQALELTTDNPACRSFPGSPLPEQYMKLAKAKKGVAGALQGRRAMKPRVLIQQAALLLLLASSGAQAAPPLADDLVLADATACRKPRPAPPPPMKESYERYNVQRRYIDLDGSGTCVLIEFWVERLSGSDSPGMRTRGHRFLHAVGKKWLPFETSLQLFPFLLRSPSTGASYLVVAPDVDFDAALGGGIRSEAYTRGSWRTGEPGMVDTYALLPVDDERGRLLRTLTSLLAQRGPADKQTPAERKRIQALQFDASEADKSICQCRCLDAPDHRHGINMRTQPCHAFVLTLV